MQRAETFDAPSILEAWRQAAARLSDSNPPYVIVVTAGVGWGASPQQLHALDSAAMKAGAERPTAVAEMLLPKVVHLSTENPDGALEGGLKLLGRGRKRGLRFSTWTHTYFERIVGSWYDRFGSRKVIKSNRLLTAIEKMQEWDKNAEAVFYIHTDLSSDSYRPRGSPCLQYIQFRAYGDLKLSVVGLYRAHDYTNKFLGNAVGLQRLGEFVARHTRREFEGLTIVSLHPFCQNKSQIKRFMEYVGE
jgi:hypothetical protein